LPISDVGLCTASGDAAIVRAVIALGHDLNLKIVAEGVRTLEQLRFSRAEGCDAVQGYLMSPAVPGGVLGRLPPRPRADSVCAVITREYALELDKLRIS